MSGGASENLDTAKAAEWLRDLLEQLGPEADAVLTAVLAERDVRGLRVVGPLSEYGRRSSLRGRAGHVDSRPAWHWEVDGMAWPTDQRPLHSERPRGTAPTRLAADRALCLALQALGWAPVEVPTEEQVAAADAVQGTTVAAPDTRLGPAVLRAIGYDRIHEEHAS
jgi:hypothetical protein